MSKPTPCPFCGGKVALASRGWLGFVEYQTITCGASGPSHGNDETAIARWNCRVSLPSSRDEVERELAEALDAAESILRYAQDFSTNCNGTKPNMTTRKALEMTRAALRRARWVV